MKIALGLLAAAFLVTGCGHWTGAVPQGTSSTPSPIPTVTTSTDPASNITEADDGRQFTITVGQTIDVALHAQGFEHWTDLASSNPLVLVARPDPYAAAAIGVTLGRFQGLAAGTAVITAEGAVTCPSGSMCPMMVREFAVRITVSA
ncbi:MAG TPA: hypothetical protein VG015_10295 [Candidatus Dormibacteraeota bacterium]|jgi:hypothetical protein|nr:hypothetical protein [Candidatus Dormibacteraeota bacterium]